MDALQEGIRVWDRDVNRYLSSNRVPLYNPVEDYLCNLGRWDENTVSARWPTLCLQQFLYLEGNFSTAGSWN